MRRRPLALVHVESALEKVGGKESPKTRAAVAPSTDLFSDVGRRSGAWEEWADAVVGAAGAMAHTGGMLGQLGQAVVRVGLMYRAARAAGQRHWVAVMAATAAAARTSRRSPARRGTPKVRRKDYGLVLSGAAGLPGSRQLEYGAQLASAVHQRRPEQALGLLGRISGRPRLVALSERVEATRESDARAIVDVVETLVPELRGTVLGQLDGLAAKLPKPAAEALQREVANRFAASSQLVKAMGQKDPAEALAALDHITPDRRLADLSQRTTAMKRREPAALLAAVSNLSPELRAAAYAHLMSARHHLSPPVREALGRALQSSFVDAARFAKALEDGDVAGTLGALGALAASPRLSDLGRGIDALGERHVPEIVDALWKLSPELRNSAMRRLDLVASHMPSGVGDRLRAAMDDRYEHTSRLLEALYDHNVVGALYTLAKITGSKRLETISSDVKWMEISDLTELNRALQALSPDLNGIVHKGMDDLSLQFPPEVRQVWRQQVDARFEGVRILMDALAGRQPTVVAEALLKLSGKSGADHVRHGRPTGDLDTLVRAFAELSAQMRALGMARIADTVARFPKKARNRAERALTRYFDNPVFAHVDSFQDGAQARRKLRRRRTVRTERRDRVRPEERAQRIERWIEVLNAPTLARPKVGPLPRLAKDVDGAWVGQPDGSAAYFDARFDAGMIPAFGAHYPGTTVIHVNGIRTDGSSHALALQATAETIHRPVIGIRNMTDGGPRDVAQTAIDKDFQPPNFDALGKRSARTVNPAVIATARAVLAHMRAGKPVHLLAHSQGAAITSSALHIVQAYAGDSKLREAFRDIRVETYGGVAERYPSGPQYVHFVHHQDPAVTTLGLLRGSPGTHEMRERGGGLLAKFHHLGRINQRDWMPDFDNHRFIELYLEARGGRSFEELYRGDSTAKAVQRRARVRQR